MAAEEWYTPAVEPAPVMEAPRARAAAFELRPLSLGEILDRTFSVYRSRFWLFAGIGAVCAALETGLQALQLLPLHFMPVAGSPPVDPGRPFGMDPARLGAMGLAFILGLLLVVVVYLLAFVMTQAATVFALGEVYLGRDTTIGASLRATYGKWYRYIGIGLWQFWSMIWVVLVGVAIGGTLMLGGVGLKALGVFVLVVSIIGGFVVGYIFWLRNSLAVQATVIEQLSVRASMRRSKVLSDGAKGRVFVVMLLSVALTYAVALLQMPLMFVVMFSISKGGRAVGSEIAMLLVTFVGHSLVQPVLMIGLSLVYFDQRVRKEALDIQILLGEERAILVEADIASPTPAIAAPYAAAPVAEVFAAEAPALAPVAEPVANEAPVIDEPKDAGLPDDPTAL